MVLDPLVETAGASFSVADGTAFGEAVQRLLHRAGRAPRLLAFGEALHGEEELLRLRNGLFRYLVEHAGYRSIAMESSCLRGRLVDAHIQGGLGDVDQVMRHGFSHGFGDSPANRSLVRWMTDDNRSRSAEERLRFLGFDAPMEMAGAESPREALSLAFTYLRSQLDEEDLPGTWDKVNGLLGDDDRWTDPAAVMDPARSIGASAAAKELRLITDDLRWSLACEAPRLVAGSSRDELWDAELAARTAEGLLAYHAAMAEHSPRRVARLLSIRDAMMADNLCALAAREARRGPALVFAHNQHLHKGVSRWQLGDLALRWHSAGALAAARLEDDYTVIGSAVGSAPHQGITPPTPDTVERLLSTLAPGAHLVLTDGLADVAENAVPRLRPRPAASNNHSYFPLDPGTLRELDAVLFLRDVVGPSGAP